MIMNTATPITLIDVFHTLVQAVTEASRELPGSYPTLDGVRVEQATGYPRDRHPVIPYQVCDSHVGSVAALRDGCVDQAIRGLAAYADNDLRASEAPAIAAHHLPAPGEGAVPSPVGVELRCWHFSYRRLPMRAMVSRQDGRWLLTFDCAYRRLPYSLEGTS